MADNVIVVENNNHLFRNKIRFDGKDENRHILEENMQAVCSAQTNQTLANLTCWKYSIKEGKYGSS